MIVKFRIRTANVVASGLVVLMVSFFAPVAIGQSSDEDSGVIEAVSRLLELKVEFSATLEGDYYNALANYRDTKRQLDTRLGALRGAMTVVQQTADQNRVIFERSLSSAEFPERGEYLDELISRLARGDPATIEDIERLWYEMQRDIAETGKVTRFPATVVFADGEQAGTETVRIGEFAIVSDGKYLGIDRRTGNLTELSHQPKQEYQDTALDLESADVGYVDFAIDLTLPSRVFLSD